MNSITSDQRKQYNRFTSDGARKALTAVNPDKDGLQQLFARGDEWQEYLIAGIQRFTAKAPNYELARTILGKDFVSSEEIAQARGLAYTEDQLATFGNTLPARNVLEWCRDNGYMLVAGPPRPLSLLEIRDLNPEYFYTKMGGWYAHKKERFSRDEKVPVKWLMLRKGPVPESTNTDWEEQQMLLSDVERVPNDAEVEWGVTTYKAARNIYLLPDIYVRTASLGSDGHRVRVGLFDARGLDVNYRWDGSRLSFLGLASARKF